MKTPVIIAAFNEEKYIGRALKHLDADAVEPIVAINGTSDATREIAESYGANVVELEEQGKLPAVQLALRSLGSRALEPVLYLDADSYPVLPRRWAAVMTRSAAGQATAAVVAGPILYGDGIRFDNAVRSTMRVISAVRARRHGTTAEVFGTNMATIFRSPEVLGVVLDMPHTWPGEDRALAHEVVGRGGVIIHTVNPAAVAMTSARYHTTLRQRFEMGANRDLVHEKMLAGYYERTADGVEARFIDGTYQLIETDEKVS